jgi:hypothetical protein
MNKRASSAEPSSGAGLRVRLWIGCLGSALLVAAALWWLVLQSDLPASGLNAELRWVWLPAIAGGALLVGVILALWLDHGILRVLRGLSKSLAAGQPSELRGLPSGWGELGELTERVQEVLVRQRQLARASSEHATMQAEIARLRESLEHWEAGARWQPPPTQTGPLSLITAALERTLVRAMGARAGTGENLRGAAVELTGSLADARETAEQAERGFVEATALLTTVRELNRLSGELQQALGAPATEGVVPDAVERYRTAASHAIEELVAASGISVSLLAEGMLKVHEVSEQVQVVANRATLIALNAVTAGRAGEKPAEMSEDLKTLAREVRAATDRVSELTRDVELDVSGATERMAAVRASVADALESVPVATLSGTQSGDTLHLMERVREMVQDATSKGERLSAAGERASRAAQRLAQQLEEEVAQLETLALGLAPEASGTAPDPARILAPGEGGEAIGPGGKLRLLGRDDLVTDAEAQERGERS